MRIFDIKKQFASKLFTLKIPTAVYFGRNILKDALSLLQLQNPAIMHRVMIVTTGRSLYKLGHIGRLTDQLKCFAEIKVYDQISADPKLIEAERGIECVKAFEPSCLIGFGGGSALDAAKAISAGTVSELSLTEMFRREIAPEKSLPIIAIPTTAGTGSELSKAAILRDTERMTKGGLRGEALFPYAAIVDASFTDTLPQKTTMETGFDVLAHAIESDISLAASPFTSMLSEYVLQCAGSAIRMLSKDLTDQTARDTMSYCSMLMGINLANTGTALPHRMQYPIGAHTDSSHAAGLAALYPAWFRHERLCSGDKICNVLKLIQMSSIEELLEMMGMNTNLRQLGISQELCGQLVNEVSGSIQKDPLSQEDHIIEKIYKESW